MRGAGQESDRPRINFCHCEQCARHCEHSDAIQDKSIRPLCLAAPVLSLWQNYTFCIDKRIFVCDNGFVNEN